MVYVPPTTIEGAISVLKLHGLVFGFFAFSLVMIFVANTVIDYFVNRKGR